MLVRPPKIPTRGWRKNRPQHARRQEVRTSKSRLARLPGIRWDLLLPVRVGYDFVGGQIAALMVAFIAAILILVFVLG
jgi:hypothetical protein